MAISLAIAVVALIIAAVAFIVTRPGSFRIQRSAQIERLGRRRFSIIKNLHQ